VPVLKVEKISKNDWLVEVIHEDKDKIACVVRELKSEIHLNDYGIWKTMLRENPEELWIELVGQFCYVRGVRLWEKLRKRKEDWERFHKKMELENLVKQENLAEYIKGVFREFKPTIYWRKAADKIARFAKNPDVVEDGKLVLFDGLEDLNEDARRTRLLERTRGFFKMKSISDLMIGIGMAKDLIAFDTRIVRFLNDHLGANVKTGKVQSNKKLYKRIEEELRRICREIEIPLSLLDRILFVSSNKSAIEYVMKSHC